MQFVSEVATRNSEVSRYKTITVEYEVQKPKKGWQAFGEALAEIKEAIRIWGLPAVIEDDVFSSSNNNFSV